MHGRRERVVKQGIDEPVYHEAMNKNGGREEGQGKLPLWEKCGF